MTDEIIKISAAQADFGDEEHIVYQVTKALFEDFFNVVVDPSRNSSSIFSAFEEQCSFGIRTLRKLLLRTSGNPHLSSSLCYLISEFRAYTLLRKLNELEDSVESIEANVSKSVLDDLVVNDEEFRRLLVLLEWCEENEKYDPKSLKDLDNDLAVLESSSDIRSETLYCRKRGRKLCDLDLDGARHGRLHGDDEDLQNKLYRTVYILLKSGRISEACALLERSGLSALIPSLGFREMARASSLTSKSKGEQSYALAESRYLFKKTLNEILSIGDSLSPLESCIWCIVAGKLEPVLTLSSNTDERLWCYANAAVECRIDSRLAEEHGWENLIDNSSSTANDLMVDSIFDEILTKERSPYYSSYRYFLTGNSFGHVSFMKNWLQHHPDNRSPHLLRFMTHTVLVYMVDGRRFNQDDAYWIFESYIQLLISMNLNNFVPFYASKLPAEKRDHVLVKFMYSLDNEESQLEVLAAAHQVGIDTSLLCKEIFAYSVDENPVTSDSSNSDTKLLLSWNWLTFSGKELIVDALIGANLLLRLFFYFDKLKEAKLLLQQSSENVAALVEKLWKENFPNQPIPCSLMTHIKEYNGYILYLEALNCFDAWFKHFASAVPSLPEKPSDEDWSRMDIHQKASYELQLKKVTETRDHHETNTKFLFQSAYSSLMTVLQQTDGWLNCFLDSGEEDTRQRNEEIASIRERYVATAITLLQTICEQSEEKIKALDVLETIADKEYAIAQILPKEQLRMFLRKFSLFGASIGE